LSIFGWGLQWQTDSQTICWSPGSGKCTGILCALCATNKRASL